MPTKALNTILDRNFAIADAKEIINTASPAIKEIVNYSTNTFARCEKSSKAQDDEDLAILILFLHTIEMADAIEELVLKSCCNAIVPLLRSIFEALLSVEYILEDDYRQRALCWNYNYIMNRISMYKLLNKNTTEGKTFIKTIKEDRLLKSLKPKDFLRSKEPIENLKSLLNKEPYKEIESEYFNFKETFHRNPKWYELFNKRMDLLTLARHLKRGALYLFLYRGWCQITHASDISRFISKTDNGQPGIVGLRNSSELANNVTFTLCFMIDINMHILKKFRPEESIASWYIREIRSRFLKLNNLSANIGIKT
ncbi:MAG: hypothetical protein GY839_03820 [candidate division Zixibacteria bacterium]|nr:hypothetical protein [candidate division Zixibacteria bacterium]